MKKLLKAFFVGSFFVFFGCASQDFFVPGEKSVVYKNLAIEYFEIAEAYVDLKNYAKAAEYYQKSMRNEDLYMTSFYKYARCLALAQDWDKARETYETLIALDPENVSLKVSVAYITAMSGKTDDAIMLYRNLVESNPDDEMLLENYITLLLNVGRGEDAETQYLVLVSKFPDNAKRKSFEQKLYSTVDNFSAQKRTKK